MMHKVEKTPSVMNKIIIGMLRLGYQYWHYRMIKTTDASMRLFFSHQLDKYVVKLYQWDETLNKSTNKQVG